MAIITDPNITQRIANLANTGTIDPAEIAAILNESPGVNLQTGPGIGQGIFKRFGEFDKVDAKVEVVTAGLWSGDSGSLTQFFTSSQQVSSRAGQYYFNIFDKDPEIVPEAEVQFAVAYGHSDGSGSVSLANDDNSLLATRATYSQYKSILLNDFDEKFAFENNVGLTVDTNDIYVINIGRARFREEMDAGNWSLTLSGSNGLFTFIDDSGKKFGDTLGKAGRIFKVVSGSLNLGTQDDATINTTTASNNEGYGLFFPDRGMIILNPSALHDTVGSLDPDLGVDTEKRNQGLLFDAIELGGDFEARRTEDISTQHFFVRATNREYNFSNNPSFRNADGTFVEPSFESDPKTFITTIGLYNNSNELIAVAKTSQPIPKSFDKEVLVKVKLSF
jgi:hypothetical protein